MASNIISCCGEIGVLDINPSVAIQVSPTDEYELLNKDSSFSWKLTTARTLDAIFVAFLRHNEEFYLRKQHKKN